MQFVGNNCSSHITPVFGKAHTCLNASQGEGTSQYIKLEEVSVKKKIFLTCI